MFLAPAVPPLPVLIRLLIDGGLWVFSVLCGLPLLAMRGSSPSCCVGVSAVAALTAVASLSAERGLQLASVVEACRLRGRGSGAQGSNPRPLHCQEGSYPLLHQGSPLLLFVL